MSIKFTDKFVRIPIRVYDVKTKELTGQEATVDSFEMIDPSEVASYRPGGGVDDLCSETKIMFKSGDSTLAQLSVDVFEMLMNEHEGQVLFKQS